MIFIENKYTGIYNAIIQRAKYRVLPSGTYVERHHIIPKCISNDNSLNNICELTAREHFICHRLLVKITTGKNKSKMQHALMRFLKHSSKNKAREEFKISSRVYRKIKEDQARVASDENKGMFIWNNGIVQVKSATSPGDEYVRARLINNKKWWTNGKENTLAEHSPGENWKSGMTRNEKVKWTDGNVSKFSIECPGPQWTLGGKKHSDESKEKIKAARALQDTSHLLGRIFSVDTKRAMSQARLKSASIKYECPHCHVFACKSNFVRWHSDNCKSYLEILSSSIIVADRLISGSEQAL